MSQTKYAKEMLLKFNMHNCNSIEIPMETSLKLREENMEELAIATLYR